MVNVLLESKLVINDDTKVFGMFFFVTGSPLMVMFIGGGGCLLLCLKSKTFDLPTFKLSLLAINQFDT